MNTDGYSIPLFKLNFDEEEKAQLLRVYDSHWISMGAETNKFELAFKTHLQAKHVLAVNSCTAALHMAMLLLNIKPGDEVILPSLTFVATANAVRYVGATPVFADIHSPLDFSISPEDIRQKITSKTKAIIAVHYAGFPCDMSALQEICEEYNLFLVEDAAHSPATTYNGVKLGTFGDISCFSFFANKSLACGEGGALVLKDDGLEARARLLRSHGMTSLSYERSKGHSTTYDVIDLGYNYRIDDLRSALAIVQLKKLTQELEKRKKVRDIYLDALQACDDKIIVPYGHYAEECSNYIFPIVLKQSARINRDDLRNKLHAKGIQTSIHYPPIHNFEIYKRYSNNSLIQTNYVANHTLTLPMYGDLVEEEIRYISNVLAEEV